MHFQFPRNKQNQNHGIYLFFYRLQFVCLLFVQIYEINLKQDYRNISKNHFKYLLNHVQLYIGINRKLQDKHLELDFLDELHLVDDDHHYSHLADFVLIDDVMTVNVNYKQRKKNRYWNLFKTYYRRGDGERLVRGEAGDRRRARPLSRSLEY